MNPPILSLLGLARRAGRLSMGYDAAEEAMREQSSCLLLLTGDLSERTRRGMTRVAEETGTPLALLACSMEEMQAAIGRRTGIVSVNDAGFAKKCKQLFIEHQPKNEEAGSL